MPFSDLRAPVRALALDEPSIHARRLREVARLMPGMVHEINNPLCAMRSNLMALEADVATIGGALGGILPSLDEPDRLRLRETLEDLKVIGRESRDSAEQVISVIGDLAWYMQAPGLEARHEGDVAEAIDRALRLCRSEVKYRIEVKLDAPSQIPTSAPIHDLTQILVNVLLNAVDALRAAARPTGRIAISARVTDEGIAVSVRDDGPGLDPDVRVLAFEPGFSTAPDRSRDGMGLTVARHLAERAGGSLHFDEEDGPGTGIVLTLPREPV